jgi:HSP20 family protein
MTYVRLTPRTERKRPQTVWNPPADIVEGNDGFTITLDVPGFTKEDLKVNVHDGILTVNGERKGVEAENEKHFRYNERPFGSFSRSFRLPDFIDGESIHGSYENGVLTVELKKKEEAKPHVITIK